MELLYIKIYTDEDLYGTVARALRSRGYDAVTTPETGNLVTVHGVRLKRINYRKITVDMSRCLC